MIGAVIIVGSIVVGPASPLGVTLAAANYDHVSGPGVSTPGATNSPD